MAKKRIEPEEDRYDPVAFDVEQTKKELMDDPAFKAAYDLLEDEFSALDVLLKARKEARLTQAEVASRMGVHPSALARIESALGSRKHSPSLETLRKYARACGKRLEIRIV